MSRYEWYRLRLPTVDDPKAYIEYTLSSLPDVERFVRAFRAIGVDVKVTRDAEEEVEL